MSEILDPTIEVDLTTVDEVGEEDYDDGGSSGSGSTMTLMSAARAHVYENGRRFHGWREVRTFQPNIDVMTDICLGSVCYAERRGGARQNGYAASYLLAGAGWRAIRGTTYEEPATDSGSGNWNGYLGH